MARFKKCLWISTNRTLTEIDGRAGLGGTTISVVQDIYSDSTTKVRVGRAYTSDIPCERGVKQGCPLSPILFDLALEQLVRAVDSTAGCNFGRGEVTILAYADDLCLVTETSQQLQALLHMTHEYAGWAGLTFKPTKCATLSLNNRAQRHYVESTPFTLGDEQLPTLRWEDHYCYLGCELGANPRATLKELAEQYINKAKTILESKLTTWQKLDALKHFVRPKLDFSLRTLLPTKGWTKQLDERVRGITKKSLRLPKRTVTQDESDLSFEEECLRHPYQVKSWMRYIDHKSSSPKAVVNLVYERALKQLPGRCVV